MAKKSGAERQRDYVERRRAEGIDAKLQVLITREDRESFKAAAKRAGETLQAWVIKILRSAAKQG